MVKTRWETLTNVTSRATARIIEMMVMDSKDGKEIIMTVILTSVSEVGSFRENQVVGSDTESGKKLHTVKVIKVITRLMGEAQVKISEIVD